MGVSNSGFTCRSVLGGMTNATAYQPVEVFGAAAVASAVGKTATAPIDRIRLACAHISTVEAKARNVARLVADSGVRWLWAGNFVNVVRYFPAQCVNFTMFHGMERVLRARSNNERPAPAALLASGAVSGVFGLLGTYPFERARSERGENSVRHLGWVRFAWKRAFVGFGLSAAGVAVYRSLYFGLHELSRQQGSITESPAGNFAASYATTVVAGVCAWPLDCVRRQSAVWRVSGRKAFVDMLRADNLRHWTNGFSVVFRFAITGAVVLTVFDLLLPRHGRRTLRNAASVPRCIDV